MTGGRPRRTGRSSATRTSEPSNWPNRASPTVDALRELEGLGAVRSAELVRERLSRLGVHRLPRGSRSSTRANPAGLTSRQFEVLDLVVAGLTNLEIAERLYLSVRTVDTHVAAVLAKLGVRSRREAAALVRSWSTPDAAGS